MNNQMFDSQLQLSKVIKLLLFDFKYSNNINDFTENTVPPLSEVLKTRTNQEYATSKFVMFFSMCCK